MSVQFESQSNSKFVSIEQSINNVKEVLNLAISQTFSSVNERIVITRDNNNDLDIESFNCDSRGIHPMQFLNRVRDSNPFCNNSWEINFLKILKLF